MDILLVRRRALTLQPAPFRCACGGSLSGWSSFQNVATCAQCGRPEYHLLRNEVTASGDARELVIAAIGVVLADEKAFEDQGFHVIRPPGARFFPGPPTITGELTNPDGTLKGLVPTPLPASDAETVRLLESRLRHVWPDRLEAVDAYAGAVYVMRLRGATADDGFERVEVQADSTSTIESLVDEFCRQVKV
jgi:hypothetical protein